jgi:hypothetical protein
MNEEIPPLYIRYKDYYPGTYYIQMNDGYGPFTIPFPTTFSDRTKYYATWLVLGSDVDLVLIDVSDACRNDINKTELAEIDWIDNVYREYDGSDVIEIILNSKHKELKYTVYKPGRDLPLELEENEKVFALIPFKGSEGYTESYLDSMILDVCF